jgi:hypothetical protein
MTQSRKHWKRAVYKIIKAEMAKRFMTFEEVCEGLAMFDVKMGVSDLRSRVSKGNVSAHLFIALMRAMRVTNLPIEDIYFEVSDE